jgi:polar amino acid transport system substrate-binding protein
LRRGEHGLDSGEYQGMFPLVATKQRQESYFMMQPVVTTSYVFIARKTPPWTYVGPQSLEGRTIGVFGPSGTSAALEEIVKANSTARLEIEVSNDVVLRKLAGGRYGADGLAFANRDVASALIAQQGIADLEFASGAQTIFYTIALSKTKLPEGVAKQFDQTLSKMKDSGVLQEILATYKLKDRLAP